MAVEAKAAREEQAKLDIEEKIRKQQRLDRAWAIKVKQWKWEQLSSISAEWDQLQKIRRFIEEIQSNQTIPKANENYANWLAWAKEEVEQRDAVMLAEKGGALPGQGEPDRKEFTVSSDWNDDLLSLYRP